MKKAKFGIQEGNDEQDIREDSEEKDKLPKFANFGTKSEESRDGQNSEEDTRPKFAKFGTKSEEISDEKNNEHKRKFGINEDTETGGRASFSNSNIEPDEDKSSAKSSEKFGIGEKSHETSIKGIRTKHLLSIFGNQDKSFWIMYYVLSALFLFLRYASAHYYEQPNLFLNLLKFILFPFIFILLDRIAMTLPFLEGITKLFVFGSDSSSFFGYIKQFFGNIKQAVTSTLGRISDSWGTMIAVYLVLLTLIFTAFYLLWYYCFFLGVIGLILELVNVLRAE